MTYEPGEVEAATLRDLQRWGPDVARSALAALALNGARAVDAPGVSPSGRALLMAQVRETLIKLAELAPEEEENDAVDEIARQRAARRGT